ncbi:hypothetical protein [Brevibacillus reuszeri]|uniref:hypothetical protein n=1 Tax=Brevibacillus reuszeri TaxID=54915 RepID=UPI002896963A|nr:hypothetical protein [Brevibacillus reuszeri]
MGITLVKITMPTTQEGALVDWQDSVQAYREKEKRKWELKLFFRIFGIRSLKTVYKKTISGSHSLIYKVTQLF